MIDLSAFRALVVTTEELLAAGINADAITALVQAGQLHRLYRGVYAIGRRDLPVPWPDRAALLACGKGSFLVLLAAGRVWDVHEHSEGLIDIASNDDRRCRHPGIQHHRLTVDPRDLRTRNGLLLTSPPRTLLDLATRLDDGGLEQAVTEAGIKRLAHPHELREITTRHDTHKGAKRLLTIVERGAWQGLTRSEAERIFRRLIQRAGLGPMRINPIRVEHRIDAVFDEHRLVVEVDGFATHARRTTFEEDHRRDAELELNGWRVLRFTARQLQDTPELVIATVASALARTATTVA